MKLTEEVQEVRRQGIGGSEIAAVVGLPSFVTPIEVYRGKTEPGFDKGDSFRMEMGDLLEPVVLELCRRRSGHSIITAPTLKHPELPLVASPDGIAWHRGEPKLVEAKTCSKWALADWGPDGSDRVPKQYFAQVQHNMHVMRGRGWPVKEALLPLLIEAQEYRCYIVPYAPDIAATLAQRAKEWWVRHVEARSPPEPDGTPSYSAYLEASYPLPQRGMEKEAPSEAQLLAKQYREAQEMEEQAERLKKKAQQEIVRLMGEAESIRGGGWRATWRADKNGKRSFRIQETEQ